LAVAENPPTLSHGVQSPLDLVGDWWVAHTKARFEKALAWDLLALGIPCFLPMIERTAIWGGRKRKVLAPLFPSYLFYCGDWEDRQSVLKTSRVCQVIPVRQRQRFVLELDAIHRALLCKRELTLYPFTAAGKRCRVARGPLQGIEGIVIRNDGTPRIVLEVSILGQGAALEIEADLLESAE